jgi:hypothetical protein
MPPPPPLSISLLLETCSSLLDRSLFPLALRYTLLSCSLSHVHLINSPLFPLALRYTLLSVPSMMPLLKQMVRIMRLYEISRYL